MIFCGFQRVALRVAAGGGAAWTRYVGAECGALQDWEEPNLLRLLFYRIPPLFLRHPTSTAMGIFGAVKSVASALSSSVGNSVVGYADRQARQRRLRRARRADLLLALLAARLSSVAYMDSQHAVVSAIRAPALANDVPGGLHLVQFRRQRPEATKGSEVHPQWMLLLGAMPTWAAEQRPRLSRG